MGWKFQVKFKVDELVTYKQDEIGEVRATERGVV